MTIYQYQNATGDSLWRVYVNTRHANGLRSQKKQRGFKTLRDAKRAEQRFLLECESFFEKKKTNALNWQSVINDWATFLLKNPTTSAATLEDYIAATRKHFSVWNDKQITEITKQDIRARLFELQEQGISLSYARKLKGILSSVFVFAIDSNKLTNNPALGISLGREEKKMPEILTLEQIRHLLEQARQLQHPWYPVWATALLTGMRSGELYALTWSDVNLEQGVLSVTKSYNNRMKMIKSTKSGDWRTVPVSQELRTLLVNLKSQSGGEHVLPRLPRWAQGEQARELRQFCKGIGLPSIKFHTLRACFATQLIQASVAPIQIQKICGWKDLETMQRYVRLAGIETEGVTEVLKILPNMQVIEKAEALFSSTCNE